MSVQPARRLLTVDEYHKMAEVGILREKHIELINGEIIEMSPIGSEHSACVNRLNKLLVKLLGDNAIIGIQNPIVLNNFSEPEPDILILKPREDFYEDRHPQSEDVFLIIEVASSSLEYDREIKLPLYAASGIREYWLVDLGKKQVEAYRDPAGKIYKKREIAGFGDHLSAGAIALTIAIDTIFRKK